MEEVRVPALVIGAGWSGIYALKYMAAEGIDAIGVDRRDVVGGLWAISDDVRYTTVADCTYTSSPKLYTEASDYPWPEEVGIYPRYDQVHEWLVDYVKHFDLNKRIWLNTMVECAEKHGDEWVTRVTRRTAPDAAPRTVLIRSKYLVVSTGVNMKVNDMSHTTKFKGFTGQVVHANDIRYMEKFEDLVRDKAVVAMGGGEGASDLSYFGSLVAKSYTLCVPNGQWMQVRNYLTRMVPIHKVAPITLDKLGRGQVLPWEYQKCVFRSFIRPMWGSNGWDRGAVCSVNGAYGHGRDSWRPVGPCYSNFGNKADLIHHAIASGRVIAKRDVVRCDGHTVHYCDGTAAEDVDVVLLCTGYMIDFPFLPEALRPKGIRSLYKNIVSTQDPSLMFVGFSRPTQGSIPQLAELASLFAARVISGKHQLPSREEMIAVAAADRKEWEIFFRYSSGRVTGLVDGIIYSRSLTDALGISWQPLEVLRTFGFRDWMRYLYCPSTVHTFLGKLPERREQFVKFIRANNLFVLSPPQVIGSTLFGLCDIFYHQFGRLENFYNETFDPRTKKVVKSEFVRQESVLEKWWLTKVWDAVTVAVIVLLYLDFKHMLIVLVLFGAGLAFVHYQANRILVHAAATWSAKFRKEYPDLIEKGADFSCAEGGCKAKSH